MKYSTGKKLLFALLMFALLAVLTVFAGAADVEETGYCGGEGDGTNLTWTLDTDGLLTISGTGKMKDYYWNDQSPFHNSKEIKTVSIGNSVTSIGDSAFMLCSSLTSVEIPNSVTSIGDYAFYWCTGLTSIVLGNGLTNIGEGAFNHCSSLTSVVLPAGVTSIGDNAFESCSSLTSIEIPNSVTTLGNDAFRWCRNLTTIKLGNGLTSIGDSAFFECYKLTSIVIPDSVTSISYWAFSTCHSLTSIEIPNSVTSISDYAFAWCKSLTSAVIPASVEEIGLNAFDGCPDDLVIFGYSGTCAQTYAEENNFIFSPIDGVPYVTLHIQQTTDTTSFSAQGVANRCATVSVLDGETLLGTAQANSAGRWSGTFTLDNPADSSDHTITATVTVNETTATATDTVRYDTNAIYPVAFALSHNNTTLDLLKVRTVNLSVLPSLPMTFTVKLNRAVTSLAVTSTKDETVKTLDAAYDAATGTWTAEGWFDPAYYNYVPGALSVRVNGSEDLAFETAKVNYLIDPSGYVYEAVKSNRVEGATAFVYYKDGETPMLWDANPFEQDNPQITDSFGVYHWDVTGGDWRVKVVKGGYAAAYSDWMTVPPEWTEVAIPLVSTAAPTVQGIEEVEGSFIITFSQYMDIDSVNSGTVKFTVGNTALAGTITPVNKEVSGTDENVEYASVFTFTPNTAPHGRVDVCIESAVNYAGKEMEASFSTAFDFEQSDDHTPGDINGDGVVNNKDLNRLMKKLAGENVECVEAALDVNGDGVVNNKDLNRLMKKLAGEDVQIF